MVSEFSLNIEAVGQSAYYVLNMDGKYVDSIPYAATQRYGIENLVTRGQSYTFEVSKLVRLLSRFIQSKITRNCKKIIKNCSAQCNVRQSALQKFLKISIKNSKCATSNKHIQDGRPGRYENRRGSKIKAKHA